MNEIAEKEASELAITQEQNTGIINAIERMAVNPEVNIDKLEKLLDMQMRVLDRDSLMAYNKDMASMQSEMPIISKTGVIKDAHGNERSKYARFEDIVRVIQPLLEKHGFSVNFKADFNGNVLEIIGQVSHRMGHKEETKMILPFDDSGAKNKVQAIGSSVSYGKRYTLCMLLNIAASGEDDDGHAAAEDQVAKLQYAVERYKAMGFAVNNNIESIAFIRDRLDSDDEVSAAEAYWEISQAEQEALYIAPTKAGAAWRTSDIAAIKEKFGQYHPNRKD